MSNKAKATAMKEDGKPALTPKLRFPEFRDAAGWEQTSLESCSFNRRTALDEIAELRSCTVEYIDYGDHSARSSGC